jgi:hypothetical protein
MYTMSMLADRRNRRRSNPTEDVETRLRSEVASGGSLRAAQARGPKGAQHDASHPSAPDIGRQISVFRY